MLLVSCGYCSRLSNEEGFAKVQPGVTEEEVLKFVGKPNRIVPAPFPNELIDKDCSDGAVKIFVYERENSKLWKQSTTSESLVYINSYGRVLCDVLTWKTITI